MKYIYLFFLIFFALVFETTVTTVPLLLDVLLIATIFEKRRTFFVIAFISGLVFDMLILLHPIGESSIFFLTFLFLIHLYERKFETQTFMFVIIFSFIGSCIFLSIFNYSMIIVQSVCSSIFAGCIYLTMKHFFKNKQDILAY